MSPQDPSIPPSGTSCPIRHLPIEVLLRVTDTLSTKDLCSMRLTCRFIETMVYNSFAEEFFYCKQFMLLNLSLEALINISKSKMSPHLRRPQFGTDMLELPHRYTEASKLTKALRCYAQCFELTTTSLARDMLAEAFANLDNLEDVVIRDCNSFKRSRDGYCQQWESFGCKTLCEEAGLNFKMRHEITNTGQILQHYPAKLFHIILDALGEAGKTPRGIEIITRQESNLADLAFCFSPTGRPKVAQVLKKLEKLHLAINMDPDGLRAFSNNGCDPASVPEKAKGFSSQLPHFLTHLHSLKDLRINEVGRFNDPICAFLQWLARPASSDPTAPPYAPGWPRAVAFPQLESLSLGMLQMDAGVLLDVIKKFAPSLKSLEMWKISLVKWGGKQAASDAETETETPRVARRFLRQICDIPGLELHHIMIGCMNESHRSDIPNDPRLIPRVVSFPYANGGNSGARPALEATISYTGPDWRNFIKEKMMNLEVIKTIPAYVPDGSSHNANMDSSDEGESDEEADDDEEEDEDDDSII